MGLLIPWLWCCALASAAPYPTTDQLRHAVSEIAPLLKSEKLPVVVLDAEKEGIALPLMSTGLRLGDGVCLVYVNGVPEDGLIQFFEQMSAQDLPIWLSSIAAHEIAHCVEQREAYIHRRFDLVLPPGVAHENLTVQGYYSVVKSGAVEQWGEALADIVSVLYFRQVVPERWKEFAGALAAMRSRNSGKWPEHNTSVWVNKMIAADLSKPAHLTLFETAFQLRRQFQPAESSLPEPLRAPKTKANK